jgi:hypothetical protein
MDGNKMLAIIEESKKAVNTAIHVQGVSHFAATGKPEDVQAIAQLLRRLSGEFAFLQRECMNLAGSIVIPQ